MRIPFAGAIDCDVHVTVPGLAVLVPYLDTYWRERVRVQQLERLDLTLTSYPPTAPLSGRADWRPEKGPPGSDFALLQREALDKFQLRYAILNCLWGSQALFAEDMAAALCRAVNDWVASEWLDRDPRLRASIMVPAQNPELAAAEIEHRASDPRFVQVLVLAGLDLPLGRRLYWPMFHTAAEHDLPVAIHAGSAYRHPPSASGWPSFLLEDYVSNTQLFAAQLASLVSEGLFAKFPTLKIVMVESGFTWLPAFAWKFNKTWRGVRMEVPWVAKPPFDIIRDHVRFTLQPIDAPDDRTTLNDAIAQLGSDALLLFSSDFPHWQFDADDVLPEGLSDQLLKKILVDNPLATYPRLKETIA
ncbi:MAG TPA: amidohydrolase family protein [Stellaceae bacterium]|nr:amidohydrolase family protein [Stellaceae bacterium]